MNRKCAFCDNPATVDTKMVAYGGSWAYLCDWHNEKLGCKIPELTNILSNIEE